MNLLQSSSAYILFAAQLIELGGSLAIVGYVASALYYLLRHREAGIERARLAVANGALAGLNFKLAATLLKTIELQTWTQLGFFAFIFLLRFILKRAFTYERRELRAREEKARRIGYASS